MPKIFTILLASVFVAMSVLVLKNTHVKNISTLEPLISPTPVSQIQVSRYGIGCISYEYPNIIGPTIYKVSDLGREGVPQLDRQEIKQINQIKKFIRSSKLSFVLLSLTSTLNDFIIFDAVQGLCPSAGIRYQVLNQRPNIIYQPGENPFRAIGSPGGMNTPYPW